MSHPNETSPSPGAGRVTRKRARTSVLAQCEPAVWLTGGSLLLGVAMIVGLLVLVFKFGLSTFWPAPLTRVSTVDGHVYMGEVTKTERYTPSQEELEALPGALSKMAQQRMAEDDGTLKRRLFRTANFRVTQRHFHWVDSILEQDCDDPEWGVVLERLEWGRFYGFPEAFARIDPFEADETPRSLEEQKTNAIAMARTCTTDADELWVLVEAASPRGPAETIVRTNELDGVYAVLGMAHVYLGPGRTWEQFRAHHKTVRQAWRERRHLEKHTIGEINALEERSRLKARRARLAYEVARVDDGADAASTRDAKQRLVEAEAEFSVAQEQSRLDYAKTRVGIDAIDRENSRYRMLFRTAGEHDMPATTALLHLDDIVRGYPANQLSTGQKFGVYVSRWGEYLADEPREANSEGGVFPAIFGTVIMTFLMIIIVVPFGVLASLYLCEYAKAGPIVSAVRIAVNNLAGVPSIVFGVFGLGFFCYGVGSYVDGGPSDPLSKAAWWTLMLSWGAALLVGVGLWMTVLARITWRSGWQLRWMKGAFVTAWFSALIVMAFMLLAQTPYFEGFHAARLPNPTYGKGGVLWASLTLALLTLPVVIVATEEALSAVPNSMREGSYACGASKWQTIKRIVLPRAMPGIMTGMVLAMARGAGEVAPLMLVGAVKLAPELAVDGIFPYLHAERSFMHLGFHIYDVGFHSQNSEAARPMVYTTTMLLIVMVVMMNVLAIYLRNRLGRRFSGSAF